MAGCFGKGGGAWGKGKGGCMGGFGMMGGFGGCGCGCCGCGGCGGYGCGGCGCGCSGAGYGKGYGWKGGKGGCGAGSRSRGVPSMATRLEAGGGGAGGGTGGGTGGGYGSFGNLDGGIDTGEGGKGGCGRSVGVPTAVHANASGGGFGDGLPCYGSFGDLNGGGIDTGEEVVPDEEADCAGIMAAVDAAAFNPEGCTKVFVGHLPKNCDEETIMAFFTSFGNVTEVMVKRDPTTAQSRGFGFVTYDNPQPVSALIENHANNMVNGHWVDVKVATREGTKGAPGMGGKGMGKFGKG
eukprot:NODE_15427_length_1050_cov_7.998917.p2 GENE.NODE_15427_length_1050_cov_7.998917~~NODE_15427_length_1050_cov_7.998917.p2  ORF type:complete len:318 (+),score=108.31 NODE_15427_length_1050_cov_7.998917:70-954(+)